MFFQQLCTLIGLGIFDTRKECEERCQMQQLVYSIKLLNFKSCVFKIWRIFFANFSVYCRVKTEAKGQGVQSVG